MTNFDDRCAQLFAAWEAGDDAPADLIGQFSDDDAYRGQVAMLQHRLSQGHAHAGWKIGQTNRKMREERGEHQPAPGFLLKDNRHTSGLHLELHGEQDWHLEPELAVFFDRPLKGPGVSETEVAEAIDSVAPAIELVRPKKTWPDRALLRAVNGATSGFVLGQPIKTQLSRKLLDDLHVEVQLDGALHTSVRAGDVNDNPLDTITWLVNYLGGLGQTFNQGNVVLAGSYAGLLPMQSGQHWVATIGDFGTVELRTQ